ncbi:pre-mRNA-processing factor 39-like [Papaver somniferum]|uniref:pre-mRNA-processing factor 39-like n=1 Tax=Papaver somniferum TaxID=3469 RepID=UPI000E6FA92C|nr:pre-mRNA-processing factor 39-like [Papaver somniferum]
MKESAVGCHMLLFERGLHHVGTDYMSFLLWNEYIKFEESLNKRGRVAVILKKVLAVPIKYRSFFLKRFAWTRMTLTEAESNKFEKAEKFVQRILRFEEAIWTPYFHLSHPDESELAAWRKYLDFIETEGDFEKVILLYERCLVACANYPEFWIRYVNFLENGGRRDTAYDALERVTLIYAKREPYIHLFRARFYEKNLHFSKARAAYQLLHSEILPGHPEALVDHARFELRQGNVKEAFSLLEKAIPAGIREEQAQKVFHSLIADEYEKSTKRVAESPPSSKAKRAKLEVENGDLRSSVSDNSSVATENRVLLLN